MQQQPPNQFRPPQQWQQQQPYPTQQPPQQWQQPTYPPQQQLTPPKKKSHKRLWLILAAVIVVFVIVVGFVSHATSSTKSVASLQATVAPTHAIQPTPKPTLKPTIHPTIAPAVTHGAPRIGGPISDFYGKYGQPNNQGGGGSETWIADQQQQTIINASPNANGEVTGVTVATGLNWSNSQTKTYCSQFIPSDASEFNSVSNLTDYHSSAGEIVLQLEPSSCVITVGNS